MKRTASNTLKERREDESDNAIATAATGCCSSPSSSTSVSTFSSTSQASSQAGVDRSYLFVDENSNNADSCFFPTNISQADFEASKAVVAARKASGGEQLLAREMQDLSLDERETIYEEIHGVANDLKETPQMRKSKLAEFDAHLRQRSKKKQAEAHRQARFLAPRYVQDPNFRLMFLRCEMMDVSKAVEKYIQHFELKRKLFGVDKLGRSLDWTDLSADDRKALSNGGAQIFASVRDRMDRLIYFETYKFYHYANGAITSQVRAIWYVMMKALENDVSIQLKGGVGIMYAVGMSLHEFTRAVLAQSENLMMDAMPIRTCGMHFCLDNPALRPLLSLFLSAAPKEVRLRTRIHFGSHVECQYALSTFGISTQVLPYNVDGKLKQEKLEGLLASHRRAEDERRRYEDRQRTQKRIVYHATTRDVLLGRGTPYQSSVGTQRMMALVGQHMAEYKAARSDRFAKTTLFLRIVQMIQEDGGRFLRRHPRSTLSGRGSPLSSPARKKKLAQSQIKEQRDDEDDEYLDTWILVSDNDAREKVAMGFRNLSRK
mmetsp:Transcript_5911/g.16044  ORF Transcript_5911/g.16044 Transcript_5911/m.16044 type:complete len:546 (-) Transcript_5911:685-2322(-)